jgi:hypothetical protein
MTLQEQHDIKEKYYSEAMRYIDNAKDYLKNAKKEDGFYLDKKYVKTACGTAYSGLLVALDGYLSLRNLKPKGKERKSIEYYQRNIAKIDKKMLNNLNSAYEILHLWGYYDGITKASVVKDGFEMANTIIEKIKPQEQKLNGVLLK